MNEKYQLACSLQPFLEPVLMLERILVKNDSRVNLKNKNIF